MRLNDILSIPCVGDAITRLQVRCFRRRHDALIRVAFSINRDYVRPFGTALTSLLLNNPGPVEAIILSADLDDAAKAPILALQRHFPELKLRFLTIDTRRLDGFQMNHRLAHISRETFFRYLLPELLPELDRVLYLDADLIVCAGLGALWATSLEGVYAAGVVDTYIQRTGYDRELGLTDDETYINAGVMLLNLHALRQAHITEQLFEFSAASRFRFMDQDAINLAFRGRIRIIPECYNVTADSIRRKIRPFRGHPAILHYTSPWKPWLCTTPASWLHDAYRRHFERLTGLAPVIRVGLLVDAFFGACGTPPSDDGRLAREGICRWVPNGEIQVNVLLNCACPRKRAMIKRVDATFLYQLPRKLRQRRRWLKHARYDLYLSIGGRNIQFLSEDPNPRKPLLLWIQNPPMPGEDAQTADRVHQLAQQGRVRFLTQAHDFVPTTLAHYRLPADTPVEYLPRPQPLPYAPEVVAAHPKQDKVVVIGPMAWGARDGLLAAIAQALPEVTFCLATPRTPEEEAAKTPINVPDSPLPNLRLLGPLASEEIHRHLLEAKVFVNPSPHEALPIACLEALACGTFVVSNHNPDRLTERFGRFIGPVADDARESVPRFAAAIRDLLAMDATAAQALRAQAVAYIQEVHAPERFQARLRELISAEAARFRSR